MENNTRFQIFELGINPIINLHLERRLHIIIFDVYTLFVLLASFHLLYLYLIHALCRFLKIWSLFMEKIDLFQNEIDNKTLEKFRETLSTLIDFLDFPQHLNVFISILKNNSVCYHNQGTVQQCLDNKLKSSA